MNSAPLPDNQEYDFIRSVSLEYNVIVRVASMDENTRGYKIDDTIVLNELSLPERRNWTFCHELGHLVSGHGADPSDEEEREADAFAAELMLPERDFIPDSKGMKLDELKELYPHSSWEVIARRCLQFHPAVLSIFDQKELTLRVGSSELNFPPEPMKEEMEVMEECYDKRTHLRSKSTGINIQGYYINQGMDIIRVILISQPDSTML